MALTRAVYHLQFLYIGLMVALNIKSYVFNDSAHGARLCGLKEFGKG